MKNGLFKTILAGLLSTLLLIQPALADGISGGISSGGGGSFSGAEFDSVTGANTTQGQWLNRTGSGTYSSQAAYSVMGTCFLTDYDPAFFTKGQTAQGTSLQNFLLDCQKKAIAGGATTFASLHKNSCFKAVTTGTTFGINISTPIVIPRYVCFDPTSTSWVRDGSSGTATANWDGDTTTQQLSNIYQPLFIFPPQGMLTGDLVINLNRVGTDRGSGVFYGRTWRVKSMSIAAGGSGFSGGESCSMLNGDPTVPAAKATFTCASASGGACTSITFSPTRWATQTGQYLLPPVLQKKQYAIANGWNGSDSFHPQIFDNDTNKNYKTSCSGSGTGLTVSPTWWADWESGSTIYDGAFGNFTPATGYLKSIVAVQSTNSSSGTYGPTYGVWISAFDVDFDFIQTGFARFGTILYGADIRGGTINDVGSYAGLKVASGGSIHVDKYIGDTSTDHYLEIDKVGNLSLKGAFLNTGSSITGAAAILVGSDSGFSGSSSQVHNMDLDFHMENGGSTSGIPAIDCKYMRNSSVKLTVSNINSSGSANSYQNNKFANLNTNCEASNVFTGSIDNVSGSLFSGTDLGVGVNVWDGSLKAFTMDSGTYRIVGSGAPTNGGSGTGVNKAGKGSLYIDKTNGSFYMNTNTAASPTWASVAGSGSKFAFQVMGTITVSNDKTNWAIASSNGTLTKAFAVAKTGPTGADLIFDIKKSTDNGSTFTSIWNSTPANRIKIAASSSAGSQTSFDSPTFNAGDIFRIDVIQIGSSAAGADATVTLNAN